MSIFKRDQGLEDKVAKAIIQFIQAQDTIDTVLGDKKFVEDKITESFYGRMVQSRNAINEFLDELCDKLNCTQNELKLVIQRNDNLSLAETSQADIEKLIDFMNNRKIVWKHLLIGLTAASAIGITIFSGGAATPALIAVSTMGAGVAATILSIVIDRMLDDLNAFFDSSRFEDIEKAQNLYKQYQKHGEYPTLTKWWLSVQDCFANFAKTWKWEPVKL